MVKKIAILLAATLAVTAAYAANQPAHFKTGAVSLSQAKSARLKNTASNQLYVCNLTNLPNQSGTQIKVSFPGTGVADQFPQPNSCVYLQSNDGSSFSTEVQIYAPSSVGSANFDSTLSSGQMWSVTYDSSNNTYPVRNIQ